MVSKDIKRIMITGASSGIGREIALELDKLDYSIVLIGRDKTRLEETLSYMHNKDNHILITFDLTNFDDYQSVFSEATKDGIKLSGLVHCAGYAEATPLRAVNSSKIFEIFNINYVAYTQLIKQYAKPKHNCGGSIVAISAINAHYPQKYMSIYAGSKAAIEATNRAFALELSEKSIRVNSVVAGAVMTNMTLNYNENDIQNIVNKQIFGWVEVKAVADAVRFLLSEDSKYMTGRELFVDGGRLGQ